MPDDGMAALFGGKDGTIDGLKPFIGERDYRRLTHGNKYRAIALEVLEGLYKELTDLDAAFPHLAQPGAGPLQGSAVPPGLKELAANLARDWSSYGNAGGDNNFVVNALSSVKTTTTNQIQPRPEP